MFTEADALSYATKDWSAIPRIARTVPFGYKIDENDPDLLQPVILELEALEKAKVHLKQFALRDVARWLSKVTGRTISHVGLYKRLKSERSIQKKSRDVENIAKRFEEARAKIEKALAARKGAGNPRSGDQSEESDSI